MVYYCEYMYSGFNVKQLILEVYIDSFLFVYNHYTKIRKYLKLE